MTEQRVYIKTYPSEDGKELKVILTSDHELSMQLAIKSLSNLIKYMIKKHNLDPRAVLANQKDIIQEIIDQ